MNAPETPRPPRPAQPRPRDDAGRPPRRAFAKPPLTVFVTTLWEYPSQHYDAFLLDGKITKSKHATQGRKDYVGATPSWVVWQLLARYTRAGDTVLDPCCGSGTTLDVCDDLARKGLGFDLNPSRDDIAPADARELPLPDASVDFAFIDPPYSTHVDYSDDHADIGRLPAFGPDGGAAYYDAMGRVIDELHRVLKDRRYMALYVSDSWRKRKGGDPGSGAGTFMPLGVRLYEMLAQRFRPVDIVCVARKNQKLQRGNWRKAAEDGNFFLRGFNYLFIMKKDARDDQPPPQNRPKKPAR